MPGRENAPDDGYYNTSRECWSVYTEVLAAEYSNAVLFGQVHQLTVDTYAVQHAGGPHPDKSVFIHLAGLHLVLERELRPTSVPPLLQRLAGRIEAWPHYPPPDMRVIPSAARDPLREGDSSPSPRLGMTMLTIFDVALANSMGEHIRLVRQWAGGVWLAWSEYHPQIASVVSQHLGQ